MADFSLSWGRCTVSACVLHPYNMAVLRVEKEEPYAGEKRQSRAPEVKRLAQSQEKNEPKQGPRWRLPSMPKEWQGRTVQSAWEEM